MAAGCHCPVGSRDAFGRHQQNSDGATSQCNLLFYDDSRTHRRRWVFDGVMRQSEQSGGIRKTAWPPKIAGEQAG